MEEKLIALLRHKAFLEGMSDMELGATLGLSRSYLSQLLGGKRHFAAMGVPKLRRVAEALGLSPLHVFLLSGLMKPEDVVIPGGSFVNLRRLVLSLDVPITVTQHCIK